MKNSLIKNNPVVVIIYGAMAVGKLTVAKELEKKLKLKLTHNHLINDLVLSVYEYKSLEANREVEKMRYNFYSEAVKNGHGLIITHCYSHNYVSPTGLSDPMYLKTLESKLSKLGAKVRLIHLVASDEVILKRVVGDTRKQFKKLTNKKIMKDLLKIKDFKTSAPVKNNLVIDNTNLSPRKVAEMIVKHLN